MKVIRPVARYISSAKVEYDILRKVNMQDMFGESHVIEGIHGFSFTKDNSTYYAMIFEEMGKSLYELLKENKYKGYPMGRIQIFAKQMIEGIGYLHRLGIIHTDLKPENILMKDKTYFPIPKENWPSNVKKKITDDYFASMYQMEDPGNYSMPSGNDVKIIDFGGAIYVKEHLSGIINTRQYRSPEVILGLNWGTKSDVWSLACILIELYTGEVLFDTHADEEHLCLIEKVCGIYPDHMVNGADEDYRRIFQNEYNPYLNQYNFRIDLNKVENPQKVQNALRNQRTLEEMILPQHRKFLEFMKYLLEADPRRRPSCEDALRHSFFSEILYD